MANVSATPAMMLIAIMAGIPARIAHAALANRTTIAVVPVRQLAAITARAILPVGQGDIGTGRVVGMQDVVDQLKEIEQPPLSQRLMNRRLGISFAELIVADMGMGRLIRGGSWMGGRGDDLIMRWVFCVQGCQFQADLEGSQLLIIQDNRFGAGRQ